MHLTNKHTRTLNWLFDKLQFAFVSIFIHLLPLFVSEWLFCSSRSRSWVFQLKWNIAKANRIFVLHLKQHSIRGEVCKNPAYSANNARCGALILFFQIPAKSCAVESLNTRLLHLISCSWKHSFDVFVFVYFYLCVWICRIGICICKN